LERWVSRVFASPHDLATAFVAKNGFRNDDFNTYLYRTTDSGKTWTSISGDLPKSPLNVIVQDRRNAQLLIAGNDLGVYVSVDSGGRWVRMKANLPTVAVHDLTIHPRENDLAIATYGRAFWVGDITPLQELSPDLLEQTAHLFDIEPRARYNFSPQEMNYHLFGDAYADAPNEPEALVVNYFLKEDAAEAKITVADSSGTAIRQFSTPAKRGLNRALVPLAGSRRGRDGSVDAVPLNVGDYLVTVEVAGEKRTKPARVRPRIQ
jgi:hypothetical protein